MIPFTLDLPPCPSLTTPDEPHVLVVIENPSARYAVADQLLDAGFLISVASSYGLVEVLLQSSTDFDLLVTAQSFGETAQFGLPELARSVQPELPILVLVAEAAGGAGVREAAQDAIARWPMRDRAPRLCH
jgi:CheY-like chemotaxis protein